ncbi:sensor histidine kinase [Kocuria rhizophila]|uniref:sensor histidine kinase n=1 Tax=Kocuria rhizophila TaxID=72000 RepID=UPI000C876663|nr:histidine kinase [Kocuria rhizophila]MCT1957148.1 histidine kinase [Kocuria rhizophila]MCT2074642.1 histidine kinase [Kocuria rhizophila]PMR90416.1 sensor histidine kinase [Kocuria rhizophila]
MSTRAPEPTPPWDTTEHLPADSEHTRPLPPAEQTLKTTGARSADTAEHPGGAAGRSGPAAQRDLDHDSVTRTLPVDRTPAAASSYEMAPTRSVEQRTSTLRHRAVSGAVPEAPADGRSGDPAATAPVREWRTFSPKTLFFGGLDLVVDSMLNSALLSLIFFLLTVGVLTVPLLGVGVLVLAATVYVLVAAVWLERRRSASSFGLDIRDPRRRRSPRTDWVRIPHQVWLDVSDGSLWLGLLHLVLTCALGWLALLPFVTVGAGVALATAPLYAPADSVVRQLMATAGNLPEWALVLLGVAAVLLSILVGVLATVAHRTLSAALLRQSEAVRLRREAAESRRRAEHESAAKESAVRGAETERSRIERDLHDGVQPQLVSVAMNLSMAMSRIDTDPAAAKELVAEAHGTTKAAITELRRLARGFHPAVLEDRGLDAAVSAVAAQAPFPVDVSVTAPRLDPRTEAAIYFAVSEGLTNAVKYSGTRSADVAVSVQDGPAPGTAVVVAGVRDFGRGGARVVPGGGLSGIQDRIRSAGGRFFVTSPVGGPTEVVVELPLTGPTAPRTTPSDPGADRAAHHGGASAPSAPGGPGQGTGGAASSYPAAGNAYPAAGEEN